MSNIFPSSQIASTVDPSTSNELTRKSYVDALTDAKLDLTGGVLEGNVTSTPSVLIIDGSDPGGISFDGALSNVYQLDLTKDAILGNPTNVLPGGIYYLFVKNGGTFTLEYDDDFIFPGGTPPVITATEDKIDILKFYCSPFDGVTMLGVVEAQDL